MINKVCRLISRSKEMEVSKTLRLQRNKFQTKKGAMFSEVALHSFEDVFVETTEEDATLPSKSVIVDLMNIFDGPLHFPPFSVRSYSRKDIQNYGSEIRERLLSFLQISHGVRELKNLGIVHRNIKLKNTVMHAKSKWVCISEFGMAIKSPTEEMILSAEGGVCRSAIAPPEWNNAGAGPIKIDKFDVYSLGCILQDLIASFYITNWKGEEIKSEVIEWLKKVQGRMVCEYNERMNIEEVIGVVEWMLYSKNRFGVYRFKGTEMATTEMWECQSKEEIQKKQKKILLAGIGQERRFCVEEWMEIGFILSFTLHKKHQTEKCLTELMGEGTAMPARLPPLKIAAEAEENKPEGFSDKEYNRLIFLIKNLNNIPLEKLMIKGMLGMGCNGIVWLVEADLRGERLEQALKMLFNYSRTAIQHSNLKNFDREFDTLSSFPQLHKNIVQILSKFTAEPTHEMVKFLTQHMDADMIEEMMEENAITKQIRAATTQFFLIEYHPLTLQQKLDNLPEGRKFSWQEIHKYSRDLLSGSLFLFNNHVVHRDVKLENILVSRDDHLILADFGESMRTDHNHCILLENLTAGNWLHFAPEVARCVTENKAIIPCSGQYSWETGCVIFEMIERRFPFDQEEGAGEGAEAFEFTHMASEAKEEFLAVVRKMIKVNVNERISIQQAWNEFSQIAI